jgi:hypothetical protein
MTGSGAVAGNRTGLAIVGRRGHPTSVLPCPRAAAAMGPVSHLAPWTIGRWTPAAAGFVPVRGVGERGSGG